MESTKSLAKKKGAYEDDDTNTLRNSHLLAIAPNANSSIILSTSPSIEPRKSNAFTHRTRAGSFLQVNKYYELLRSKAPSSEEDTWLKNQIQSIILEQGSVQHLDYLTDYEKAALKLL